MADQVYVAKETFFADVNGEQVQVKRGVTRIREGHPLLAQCGHYFEPADKRTNYEVEDATAEPGGSRGDPQGKAAAAKAQATRKG